MRPVPVVGCLVVLASCGSGTPKADAPPASASAPRDAGDDPTLTQDECTSLAEWIGEACHERANQDRSTRAEGWCSDVAGSGESQTKWVADCAKHVKKSDDMCFRSSPKVRLMMTCDETVDRSR
jgi:hypothetical protein